MARDPKDLDKDEAPLLEQTAEQEGVPNEQSNEIPKHNPKGSSSPVPLPAD